MGVSIGRRLKAVAIVFISIAFFLVLFTGMQAERVEARANLTAYTTVPPNSWEPLRYNVTGTAPYFITHTLNWSNTRLMGNVGISDGSVRTLNGTSNRDVNYTDNNFMAADISMAPWNPGRLTALSSLANVTNVTNITAPTKGNATNATPAEGNATNTTGNTSNSVITVPNFGDITLDIPRKVSFDNNTTQAAGNVTNKTAGNVTAPGASGISFNRPLNDPYHPILMGRPVDDLLYEYPLATTINMYGRLLGLRMPGGSCANIGVKCLGYGY
jgi:hypothetical protein